MASVEQREAVKEVRSWYRRNEDRCGLPPGYTKNFSLVQYRRREALRVSIDKPEAPEASQQATKSFKISLPNFRIAVTRLEEFFQRAAIIYHDVVKYPHARTSRS